MSNYCRKALYLNPNKIEDESIIKFLETKDFSKYVKSLILNDMNQTVTIPMNTMNQMLALLQGVDIVPQKNTRVNNIVEEEENFTPEQEEEMNNALMNLLR